MWFRRKKTNPEVTQKAETEKPEVFSITVLSIVEAGKGKRKVFLHSSKLAPEKQPAKVFLADFVGKYRGATGFSVGTIETMSLQDAVNLYERNGAEMEDPRILFPEHYAARP